MSSKKKVCLFKAIILSSVLFIFYGCQDSVVKKEFRSYKRVAVLTNMERSEEELFLPLYMKAFPDQSMVDRRDLTEIIGEQDMMPERMDAETRAKIKRIYGVEAIIYPNFSDKQFAIKVVDTETGVIVAATAVSSNILSETIDKRKLIRQAVKSLKNESSDSQGKLKLNLFN